MTLFPINPVGCCNNNGKCYVSQDDFNDLSEDVSGIDDRVTALEQGGTGVAYEEVTATYDSTYGWIIDAEDVNDGLYLIVGDTYSYTMMYDGTINSEIRGGGFPIISGNVYEMKFPIMRVYDDTVPSYSGKMAITIGRLHYSGGSWSITDGTPTEGLRIYRLTDN